jgi:hypothetical protein
MSATTINHRLAGIRITILPLLLFLGLSGCGLFLPSPSHKLVVEIDPELSNVQLTDRLLTVLTENGLTECRGIPQLNEDLPACSVALWQGNLTRIDRIEATIEVGEFPSYATNSVGHSARFRRSSDSTLEIIVKGVFFYYGDIPNDEAARDLATLINDEL